MRKVTNLELTSEAPSFDSGAITLGLQRVEGRAALSELFRYELEVVCRDGNGVSDAELDELLRHPCAIEWVAQTTEGVKGVLESVESASVDDANEAVYRAVLVPRVARLAHAVRSRVFQDATVVDIARAVLLEHGFVEGGDFYFSGITQVYPTSEYTVQFEESDLAFLQRLLEHHGIHYHFRFSGVDELHFGDTNASFAEYHAPQVDYVKRSDKHATRTTPWVHSLTRSVGVRPARVLLTDYNWRTPAIALGAEALADEATGQGLLHQHRLHYKTPAEGQRLAQIRAEEILCGRVRFRGEGGLEGLEPGMHFELVHHPLGEYQRSYLVVSVGVTIETSGSAASQGEGHIERRFEATDATTTYRPPLVTPKPRIYGIMHGRIDGPAHSTAAPIDEHGRYKVLFPYDLNGRSGGRASRWIRVAQPSSGAGYGVHLPMHIGAEVAIAHLDGDPDRPVIVGSVHNAATYNPVSADNATMSQIRTQAGVRILLDDDV